LASPGFLGLRLSFRIRPRDALCKVTILLLDFEQRCGMNPASLEMAFMPVKAASGATPDVLDHAY
jgi:hypothetical protein